MSTTRRRLLDDTFKKSVVGNPAIATDSLARMYPGIEMQGWTEQDGTPTPEAPVPIVNSGTQNQETGKWDYEITIANAQTDPDKNQTVTLTADRPLTKWDRLEKRGGQWGWVYKSEEIESYTDGGVPGEYYSTTGQLSAGAQVWYETTTETFVPLTTAEQEAMNALYTYRPTTVLSNQQGCQMALTYKTRKGVGGGNLLDYRKLVNPAYWIGTTPTNAYKYFDIVLKNNTKYKLSCTKNNMNKDYIDEHPIDFGTAFYMGENPGTFRGNYGFGLDSSNAKQTEYQFTTTGNPYYLNLCINPANKFTPENLHIVFDELLPGLKLQEVT